MLFGAAFDDEFVIGAFDKVRGAADAAAVDRREALVDVDGTADVLRETPVDVDGTDDVLRETPVAAGGDDDVMWVGPDALPEVIVPVSPPTVTVSAASGAAVSGVEDVAAPVGDDGVAAVFDEHPASRASVTNRVAVEALLTAPSQSGHRQSSRTVPMSPTSVSPATQV